MSFPEEALKKENWYEVSNTFQTMKARYGTSMANYILYGWLDEGKTIEDIEIEE